MQDLANPRTTDGLEQQSSGSLALRERVDAHQESSIDTYDPTHDDMAAIERLRNKFGRGVDRWRAWIHRRPWVRVLYRTLLAVVGGLVILAGIAMLVLPGPGWLTIFLGLAILGSEFHWAHRLLSWLREQVRSWWHRYRTWRENRREAKAAKLAQKEAREQAKTVDAIYRDLGE